MIEGPDDWAVFMDPEVFGETVFYEPEGGEAQSLPAIFTAAHATVADTATVSPVLSLAGPLLGFIPAAGDAVTVRGITYRVAEPQPDGTGLIRCILERV